MRCVIMPHGSTVEHKLPFRSDGAVRKEMERYAGSINVLQMVQLKDINPALCHYMAIDAASPVSVRNDKATRLYASSHPDERPPRVIVGPVVIYPETDIAHWSPP